MNSEGAKTQRGNRSKLAQTIRVTAPVRRAQRPLSMRLYVPQLRAFAPSRLRCSTSVFGLIARDQIPGDARPAGLLF